MVLWNSNDLICDAVIKDLEDRTITFQSMNCLLMWWSTFGGQPIDFQWMILNEINLWRQNFFRVTQSLFHHLHAHEFVIAPIEDLPQVFEVNSTHSWQRFQFLVASFKIITEVAHMAWNWNTWTPESLIPSALSLSTDLIKINMESFSFISPHLLFISHVLFSSDINI